ncbi:hypothetical protein HHI36_016822 [Cryptolaemus montrouzieri]|uniref:Uncharacterized protein n=1 Tax=Cryptolaemus montrouzieri TaxID=559131 RepID=A0ABD2NLA1_9CUCU
MKTLGLTEGDVRNMYKKLTREINAATEEDKNAYFDFICQEMEQQIKKVRSLNKAPKPRILITKAKNGEQLTSKSDVIERWKTYCQDLMDDGSTDSHLLKIEATEDLESPILKQEVEKAVQRLNKKQQVMIS